MHVIGGWGYMYIYIYERVVLWKCDRLGSLPTYWSLPYNRLRWNVPHRSFQPPNQLIPSPTTTVSRAYHLPFHEPTNPLLPTHPPPPLQPRASSVLRTGQTFTTVGPALCQLEAYTKLIMVIEHPHCVTQNEKT